MLDELQVWSISCSGSRGLFSYPVIENCTARCLFHRDALMKNGWYVLGRSRKRTIDLFGLGRFWANHTEHDMQHSYSIFHDSQLQAWKGSTQQMTTIVLRTDPILVMFSHPSQNQCLHKQYHQWGKRNQLVLLNYPSQSGSWPNARKAQMSPYHQRLRCWFQLVADLFWVGH